MMIPEYMRFYGQSPNQVLSEYAITFFALCDSMYRIQAKEILNEILAVSSGMNGDESKSVVDDLRKQSRGMRGIVDEVKGLERLKGN